MSAIAIVSPAANLLPLAFYAYQWQIIRLSTIQPAFDCLVHPMLMNDKTSNLIAALQALTQDLLWMSETDAPFEIIQWQNQSVQLTNEQLLKLTGHSLKTPIEILDLDNFFSAATIEQDWFGDEEKATAKRYQELASVLKQHLNQLKVYRVGAINIDIYIVGETESGEIIGLATEAVET
ncbi:nuclease A inhibitor family protein [Leptolyngbyaceae cyanobacterium UHCC 1019]